MSYWWTLQHWVVCVLLVDSPTLSGVCPTGGLSHTEWCVSYWWTPSHWGVWILLVDSPTLRGVCPTGGLPHTEWCVSYWWTPTPSGCVLLVDSLTLRGVSPSGGLPTLRGVSPSGGLLHAEACKSQAKSLLSTTNRRTASHWGVQVSGEESTKHHEQEDYITLRRASPWRRVYSARRAGGLHHLWLCFEVVHIFYMKVHRHFNI